jgi:hypothetical protein
MIKKYKALHHRVTTQYNRISQATPRAGIDVASACSVLPESSEEVLFGVLTGGQVRLGHAGNIYSAVYIRSITSTSVLTLNP